MYEIPQKLEYKEKIIFGLTFPQLAYALVFLPIIFILLFKLNIYLFIRIVLAMIPSMLAIGFMFFDLLTHLKNWYAWFKSRNLNSQKKVEGALACGKVHDNYISFEKKKIGVIKVDSINFAIKPQKEKETISYVFQKFLNSIDFPVQILMTTETLDLNGYLNGLEQKTTNKQSKNIFESYKQHMKESVEKNTLMQWELQMKVT